MLPKKGKFKKFKCLQKEWTEFVYSSLKGPAGRVKIVLSYTSYREAKTEMKRGKNIAGNLHIQSKFNRNIEIRFLKKRIKILHSKSF